MTMTADLSHVALPLADAPPAARETFVMPASFAQRRLWFLDRLEPGNPVYNIPLSLRLTGRLNVPALEAALNEIVRRHEILRTTFVLENDEPVQVIHPFVPFPLTVTGLPVSADGAHAERVRHRLTAELERTFDLERGPLLRVELVRERETEHVLALTVHHIVFDGWSRDVFLRELQALYEAFPHTPLAELPIQYADFAVWQRNWLQGQVLARELAFWQEQLADAPPLLELPTDRPRPAAQSYRGARESFSISAEITARLESLSRRAGASLFMTLLAAFQVLLYRHTGQPDILLGTPIANRNRRELEGLIGFFVNTLVMRGRLQADLPFSALLAQVRQTAFNAYAHQDLPFEKLVEALQPARSLAYAPVVQVAMNYLQARASSWQLGDLRAEIAPVENNTTKFDLTWNVTRSPDRLHGSVEYSTDLFERATIARWISQWQVLLEAITAAPDTPVGRLALLTPAEREQLLVDWNTTAAEYPQECLHESFEAQVRRAPDAVALVHASQRVSLRELNARANQLAHSLQARGVVPGSAIGVMLERSPDLIASLLAIWKAGGAYVPLDPAYPRERLRQMLDDARPPLVITETRNVPNLPAGTAVLCLDRERAGIAGASVENLDLAVSPDDPAYILYTSGSTGEPKGVVGQHRGLMNRLAWMRHAYPFRAGEGCCQKTSLNFIDSIAEIFGPLLQGVPLVVLPDETVRDPQLLVAALASHGVTRLTLVPSHLRALLHSPADLRGLSQLRLWVCSGEALDAETARAFYRELPGATLLNLYGSSEASADSAYFQVPIEWASERVPIGRPIANTQIYILDPQLEPVPVGTAGELYIGGTGLARGYLNQPELTAQKFIPHPFLPSAVLYKTGDLARFRPDGTLEYLGRADRQVKLRGMRVELGEIEAALVAHPRVQEAVVVLKQLAVDDSRLIAYVAADADGDSFPDELRTHLQARLPAHMIPSAFVALTELPRTPTGKVDRVAVARRAEERAPVVSPEVLPRDALESKLQTVWQHVLKVERVGMTDDFFDLGGHSLLAIVLFGEMEKALGDDLPHKKLPLATLFQAPTIEKLARVLRADTQGSEWSPLVPIQPRGTRPPFFCVHGFGGGVVGYAHLARLLGEDQPFYGLQARGQEEDVEPDSTLPEMAARYLREIRRTQPTGPYYLGGYCYGGTVALEVAQQLVAQGEAVRFLGMFENPAPKSQYRRFKPTAQNTRRFLENLPYWAADFLELDWMHRWRRLEREVKQRAYHRSMRSAVARGASQLDLRDVLDDVAPLPLQHLQLIRVHIGAMMRYEPQPYAGRITVFRTRRQPLLCSHDPYLGWRELTPTVDVRLVSGSHHNLLEAPFVESLARELQEALELAQREG